MGVVTRAMAKQQVAEADGDNLHDEGSTVEDNMVDDEHPSSVEKHKPVLMILKVCLSLPLHMNSFYKSRPNCNDTEIQQLRHYALDEHKVDTVLRGYFIKDAVLMGKWSPPPYPPHMSGM